MATSETSLQVIYANMVQQATFRLNAAQGFLASYGITKNLPDLEAAVLQIRKRELAGSGPTADRAAGASTTDLQKHFLFPLNQMPELI